MAKGFAFRGAKVCVTGRGQEVLDAAVTEHPSSGLLVA
ncbi:hypothetical protein Hypma_001623 [Hypsizygus marmoreus]|uniref:Uncharacterized protein n=1 Tax=Hypsizygus marmoreus TaxID=39966 RepID=A0A369JDF6_HYPMA|nr:hypothetical protein Hypma_001623 [Hypsizygus marmoreus]